MVASYCELGYTVAAQINEKFLLRRNFSSITKYLLNLIGLLRMTDGLVGRDGLVCSCGRCARSEVEHGR